MGMTITCSGLQTQFSLEINFKNTKIDKRKIYAFTLSFLYPNQKRQ